MNDEAFLKPPEDKPNHALEEIGRLYLKWKRSGNLPDLERLDRRADLYLKRERDEQKTFTDAVVALERRSTKAKRKKKR